MKGGMSGSHLRWSVYEDMVNLVWPKCSEQERRNMFLIMRRDLGTYWRPDGWNGHARMTEKGEGEWKPADEIFDRTPWERFRQVLARFDPDNQYEVKMRLKSTKERYFTVRAYLWDGEYRVDWSRRCDYASVAEVKKLEIPDDGTM